MSPVIEKLDLNDINSLEDWFERFELMCSTNKEINSSNKTAYYLTLVGKEGYSLLKDLMFPSKVANEGCEDLHKVLVTHLKPVNFEALERAKFHTIIREPNENLNHFLLRLQNQASKCNFGSDLKNQLKDRLIVGINEDNLQKELLLKQKLTFDIAKMIVENYFSVKNAFSKSEEVTIYKTQAAPARTKSFTSESKPFHNTSLPKFNAKNNSFNLRSGTASDQNSYCYSCGGKHNRSKCKFRDATCFKCHKVGHIAKICRSNKSEYKVSLTNTKLIKDEIPNQDIIPVLHMSCKRKQHVLKVIKLSNGNQHSFIIDTGSPISIISKDLLIKLDNEVRINSTNLVVQGITGHNLKVIGSCYIQTADDIGGFRIPFVVVESGPSVLGLDALEILNITLSMSCEIPDIDDSLLKMVKMCAEATGGMRIEPIKLKYVGKPQFFKARQLPLGLKEPVSENLLQLEKEGIIEKVSLSSWATPLVTVLKKNGKVRLCGDYRITINPVLCQSACITPDFDQIFAKLSGARYFSKIDLQNAFLQIPLDESSKEVTTLNTPFGLYRYNFLPFGLSVSPGIFQGVINKIIDGLLGVLAYQDDVLVFAETKMKHDQYLKELLTRFAHSNIRINITKSKFCITELQYLGYKVDGKGISPDLSRINWDKFREPPRNNKELKALLGFFQFYSKFIVNYSSLIHPLLDLLNSDNFEWHKLHQEVLLRIVEIISSKPVLKCFDNKKPITIYTDASEYGIGAILEQDGFPVICISRKLSHAESRYSVTQREALAIHWSIKRLHKYLFGHRFQLITDHEALKHIFSPSLSLSKATSTMLTRWAVNLSAYNYDIVYKSGKFLTNADYLSRYPQSECLSKTTSLFTAPLSVDRNELMRTTKAYYGPILAALKSGWSHSAKKRFPQIYVKREELSLAPDGVIQWKDLILIPPSCRESILNFLHSGHLGIEKMKSLARMTCWWPTINNDIANVVRECKHCCNKNSRVTYNLSPWPVSYKPMQRLHGDYCGPFLNKYYALVLIDSYSRFPEVFLTTHATSDFTRKVLQKFFAREGIAQVLVTDNGTHFRSDEFEKWLKLCGCSHVFSPPRHPQSNGLAENFVKILKSAISAITPSNLTELDKCIDNFLLQYRNSQHCVTKQTPAFLFKGRNLRSALSFDTSEVMFFRGNENRISYGIVLRSVGNKIVEIIDVSDNTTHKRHIDQISFSVIKRDAIKSDPIDDTEVQQMYDNDGSLSDEADDDEIENVHNEGGIDDMMIENVPKEEEKVSYDRPRRKTILPKKYQDFILESGSGGVSNAHNCNCNYSQ